MTKLVEFVADSYPHVKGDVVKIDDDALKLHNKSAYVDYSVKKRADDAEEAELVEGRVKTVPTSEGGDAEGNGPALPEDPAQNPDEAIVSDKDGKHKTVLTETGSRVVASDEVGKTAGTNRAGDKDKK